jgi:hypothetical protein
MVATPIVPRQAYDEKRSQAFIANLVSALGDDDGIRVGLTALVPLGNATGWTGFRFPGEDKSRTRQLRTQDVSANYFDLLEIPLVAGRVFLPSEPRGVVLINEAMARQHFPGDNPIGRTLVMAQDESFQINGIVRDGLLLGLGGGLLVSRALEGYTDRIGSFDLVTYGSVGAILAVAALVATYVPVRRAARVDPATALRCE